MKRPASLVPPLPNLPQELQDLVLRECGRGASYRRLAELRAVCKRVGAVLDEVVRAVIEHYTERNKGVIPMIMARFHSVVGEKLWYGLTYLSLYEANYATVGLRLYKEEERVWWQPRTVAHLYYHEESTGKVLPLSSLENVHCGRSGERARRGIFATALANLFVDLRGQRLPFFSLRKEMSEFRRSVFSYMDFCGKEGTSPQTAYRIKRRALELPRLESILEG